MIHSIPGSHRSVSGSSLPGNPDFRTDAQRVLGILYHRRGGYCLLSELSKATDLPPERLREAMEELRSSGQPLDHSPALGVRLAGPVRLSSGLIETALGTTRIGRSVLCFRTVQSTNDVAWDSARHPGRDGLVVLAEEQSAGRGRFGRQWISPPSANVLMSILLEDGDQAPAIEALTVAAGLAVAEGMEAVCPLELQLKWPNDVLLDGRKLCGVLLERRRIGPRSATVLGIGINVSAHPPRLGEAMEATCLAEHLPETPQRVEVIREVLRRLDHWMGNLTGRGLEALHKAWMRRCGMIHQRIEARSEGRTYVGTIEDIDPLRGLVLVDDRHVRHFLPAAGTTLRPG